MSEDNSKGQIEKFSPTRGGHVHVQHAVSQPICSERRRRRRGWRFDHAPHPQQWHQHRAPPACDKVCKTSQQYVQCSGSRFPAPSDRSQKSGPNFQSSPGPPKIRAECVIHIRILTHAHTHAIACVRKVSGGAGVRATASRPFVRQRVISLFVFPRLLLLQPLPWTVCSSSVPRIAEDRRNRPLRGIRLHCQVRVHLLCVCVCVTMRKWKMC